MYGKMESFPIHRNHSFHASQLSLGHYPVFFTSWVPQGSPQGMAAAWGIQITFFSFRVPLRLRNSHLEGWNCWWLWYPCFTDMAGNTPVLNSNLGNYLYARIKTFFFSLCLFSPETGDLCSKQPNQVSGKACLLTCARISVFGGPRNPLRQSCLTTPAWWLRQ